MTCATGVPSCSAVLTPTLHGRDREQATLGRLASTLSGAGLLIDGEPGVGKSALLAVAAAAARDAGVRVLMVTAARRRGDRPMQLLNELLSAIPEHRPPQMSSLDELVLTALRAAADERPTLVVVDDAHRLDDLSWEALVGAARMLHAEPFGLLMAGPASDVRVREAGLPVLTIGPLDATAAAAVLDDGNADLPLFVRQRILDASAGNPLALTELAHASRDEWQRRCIRPPVALPLTAALIESFGAPLRRLPAVTQEVLLAAAANDTNSLPEAARAAAATLAVPVEETLAACLIAVEHRIVVSDAATLRFRSEVARSAVYEAAPLPRRRALHLAFADLLPSPSRGAWHRAAASLEPDEGLAVQLESASAAIRARGRIRDALATMDRAARVSQDEHARTRRLIEAAEMGFEIGRPDFVATFASQAEGLAEDARHRRDIAVLRATYELWRPDGPEGVLLQLARAEEAHAEGDADRTRTALTRAIEKVEVCVPGTVPLRAIEATAARVGGLAETPGLAGVLTAALPLEHGRAVLETIASYPPDAHGDLRLARLMGEAASLLGHDAMARRSLSAAVDGMRVQGRYGMLPFALTDRARSYAYVADLDLAAADAQEAAVLADETGQPVVLGRARAVQALVEGLCGNADQALRHADEAEKLAFSRPALLVDVHLARGVTELVRGEHEAAYSWLRRLWEPSAPMVAVNRRWARIGDLAEAAVGCGAVDAVRPLVEELSVAGAALPSPALRAGVAHARALLASDSEDAGRLFDLALTDATGHGPLSAGRVQLAHGIWLRRRRAVSAARMALRSAIASFEQVGARTLADRAAAELRAAGVARAVPTPALAELTAQELEIARLAAAGLTNREIGARLFLSHRTVGTHLYHLFPKLGITSRAQLGDALRGEQSAG